MSLAVKDVVKSIEVIVEDDVEKVVSLAVKDVVK